MTTPRVRASDTEREQVASVLRSAMGEGRLSLSEGEERLAAAYATVYQDELAGLTADLPPAEPSRRRRRGPDGPGPRRPFHPVAGLIAVAALVAGVWAVATGGVIWPAIVLGIVAISMVKKHRRHHWHHRPAEQAPDRHVGCR